MKKTFTFIFVLISGMIFMRCTQSDQFVINGSVENENMSGKKVFITIYNNDGQEINDSTTITTDGTFSFAGSVESPCLAFLSTEYEEEEPAAKFHFFLENSKISITLIESMAFGLIPYFKPTINGSKSDAKFRKECGDCFQEHIGTETWEGPALNYIESNSGSIYSPFLYYTIFFNNADYKSFCRQMEKFSGDARNTYHYKLMQSKEAMKKHISTGAQIPDFTLADRNGNEVNVLQFAKDKNFVLVTFWASWCGPCRKEIRDELIPLYNEFHESGFDILSVSVDDNRDKWIAAQTAEKLPWTDLCELTPMNKSMAQKSFGINSVPYSFLIDGGGKIIAHGTNIVGLVKYYLSSSKK